MLRSGSNQGAGGRESGVGRLCPRRLIRSCHWSFLDVAIAMHPTTSECANSTALLDSSSSFAESRKTVLHHCKMSKPFFSLETQKPCRKEFVGSHTPVARARAGGACRQCASTGLLAQVKGYKEGPLEYIPDIVPIHLSSP